MIENADKPRRDGGIPTKMIENQVRGKVRTTSMTAIYPLRKTQPAGVLTAEEQRG